MDFVQFTDQRCPELADFLESCCCAPLSFDGVHPLEHSSQNHIHLWCLEWWADRHAWIDLEYRLEFSKLIFRRWRERLKGLPPYNENGYRMYLYSGMAPSISVVAETKFGFPYGGEPTFVDEPKDIMALYLDRSWRSNFQFEAFDISHTDILAAIESTAGSIGKPTANKLGLKVGTLRKLIEEMSLGREVNDIRKKYKRRPAKFRPEEYPHEYTVYEQKLPAKYR